MEGPSLVILMEDLAPFVGTKVTRTGGTLPLASGMARQTLKAVKSWGKHALLFFDDCVLRIHFLMFGSYRIDEEKPDREPKLQLHFRKGRVNFYSCAIRPLTETEIKSYDWSIDLMAEDWEANKAIKKVKAQGDRAVCDVLMDQGIFAGLGNIMKNEVLFIMKLHPDTPIAELSPGLIKRLVKESHDYSWQFYHWKKAGVLKKNWKIFRKRKCPDCAGALTKAETGEGRRVSYFCPACQARTGSSSRSKAATRRKDSSDVMTT